MRRREFVRLVGGSFAAGGPNAAAHREGTAGQDSKSCRFEPGGYQGSYVGVEEGSRGNGNGSAFGGIDRVPPPHANGAHSPRGSSRVD
jgi:hypothetical protein